MSVPDELTPEERAAADAAVAALRARPDFDPPPGGLLGGSAPQDGVYDGTPRLPPYEERLAAARADIAANPWLQQRSPDAPAYENPTEKTDRLVAEQEQRLEEDFSAFWAQRDRKGKTLRNVVPGVDVTLPAALPLAFEIEARRLQGASDLGAIHRVFGMLYGRDTLARLIEGGLDGEQLAVLIAWGAANAGGKDMTLEEVSVEVDRMRAEKASGKAPGPRADGTPSFGSGGSSRRTSRGSTGTRKKKSKR